MLPYMAMKMVKFVNGFITNGIFLFFPATSRKRLEFLFQRLGNHLKTFLFGRCCQKSTNSFALYMKKHSNIATLRDPRRMYFRPEVETPANLTFVASLFRSLNNVSFFYTSGSILVFKGPSFVLKHDNSAVRATKSKRAMSLISSQISHQWMRQSLPFKDNPQSSKNGSIELYMPKLT